MEHTAYITYEGRKTSDCGEGWSRRPFSVIDHRLWTWKWQSREKKVSGKNGSEIVGRISERIRRWRVNRKSQLECRKSEIGKFGCILGPDGPTIGRCIGERQDGTLGPASRPIKSWSVQLGSKTRSRLVHEEARSPRRTRVTETTPRKAKPGREKKF